MSLILTKKARKIFPEGVYGARIEKIETGESKFDAKEIVKLQFRTEYKPKPNEAGWMITLSCTASLHENSKLNYVVEQITGQTLKENEDFDLENLKNKDCSIRVEHQTSETGKTYAKVAEVFSVSEDGATSKNVPF